MKIIDASFKILSSQGSFFHRSRSVEFKVLCEGLGRLNGNEIWLKILEYSEVELLFFTLLHNGKN